MRSFAAAAFAAAIVATTVAASLHAKPHAVAAASAPTVTLTVDAPENPFLHHTVVTVSWALSGGDFDPVLDYVTSWWDPFPQTYVEYHNVTGNTGSASFRLLNARHAYRFRYYRGNTSIGEAAASVAPDATYPMGVRAVLHGTTADEVQILWTSNRSLGELTAVQYGTDPHNLDMVAPSVESLTYTAAQLNAKLQLPPIARRTVPFDNLAHRELRCHWGTCYNDFTANELWVDPGLHHVAVLRRLIPGTKYYYRVGEVGGHMSAVRSFTSKVAPGPNASVSVLYVADAGAGYATGSFAGGAAHNDVPIPPSTAADGARYVWDAIKADPKFHSQDTASIMNGDISYARGWPLIWELFHNETEDVFGVAPVMVSYGNHEFDYGHNPFALANGGDSGGEAGVATGVRFNIKDETRPWYYVEYGPVFFVSLSSEHDPVEQAQWLRDVAFAAFDRALTPWLVVFLHRPLYESNQFDDGPLQNSLRAAYTDLFVRAGVDAVLMGHAHYYERLCQISNNACDTWGYRDVWTQYMNVQLDLNVAAHCVTAAPASDSYGCRVRCAQTAGCTGMLFNETTSACSLVSCQQPFPLTSTFNASVWNMDRQEGAAPVYIVDGTAGGVFTPLETPASPWTEYKDFSKWGYSRIEANGTTLTWRHHHIDGSVVDEVTLAKPNPL